MAIASSACSQLLTLPEMVEGLPNICGWEQTVETALSERKSVFLETTNLKLADISAGFAIALHMHQPAIPAGKNGELINNLQYMFEHPLEADNYNAGPFAYCYSRIGDFVPELVEQGCNPRIMLDYTGTLLWGFQQMGRRDTLTKLRRITCDRQYQPYVEWLGTFWSHSLADSLPEADIKLQIQAWQHHFAALFGWEALSRVRGFSLPEMVLPRDPDRLHLLIKTLRECGYEWMVVPKASVETPQGNAIEQDHLPHQLIATNTANETCQITVFLSQQASETPAVGKMQPYYDAKQLMLIDLGNGVMAPPLVTQIADGENSGVMMNEFPSAFKRAWHEMGSSRQGVVALNGTEYLELLKESNIEATQQPRCRAVNQKRHTLQEPLAENLEILNMVHSLSQQFHQVTEAASLAQSSETSESSRQQDRYRKALLHNLLLQTSCFRCWEQDEWTQHAKEIYRRGQAILTYDF